MKTVIVLRNLYKGKKIKIGNVLLGMRNGKIVNENHPLKPDIDISINKFIEECDLISNHKIQEITSEDYIEGDNDGTL